MKKKNFIALIMGTIGGLLFALGMCMCLLPEWAVFKQGVAVAAIGVIVLIAMAITVRKMSGKPAIKLNAKAIGTIIFGIIATIVLGVGMCSNGMEYYAVGNRCWHCGNSIAVMPYTDMQRIKII